MAEVHGTNEPRFDGVRRTLSDQLDSGADLGASVAVFLHGEPVVDIWGGWADEDKTRPWERDTLTNVWSTTKTMTFLVALMLHDREQLDFHAPVTDYWPEFGANGKERIEVRHIMGHTAGLSGWEEPLAAEDLANWELCVTRLADQAPWWEPGTASGYHARRRRVTSSVRSSAALRARASGPGSPARWPSRSRRISSSASRRARTTACPTSSHHRPSMPPPWKARSQSSC